MLARLVPIEGTETIDASSRELLGRVLAEEIVAPMSLPPFRASAMDGYACRAADITATPTSPGQPDDILLTVVGNSLAGHPSEDTLAPGTCVAIMTGARVPDDADSVIPCELTERVDGRVRFDGTCPRGQYVREVGSDTRKGQPLLVAGSTVGPAAAALLIAHGCGPVKVKRRLSVALFSTGDELVAAGSTLIRGQIHDANRPLLEGMLGGAAIDIIDLGICPDTPDTLRQLLTRAEGADLLISTGGVSVGDADHVRAVLGESGSIDWWRIAMKPGRPLAFGFTGADQPWLGLPGNPVSVAVTTLMFVHPAIDRLLGRETAWPLPLMLPTRDRLEKDAGRVEFQRGTLVVDEQGAGVSTTGAQDSHMLSSLVRADCLVELDRESTGAAIGEPVKVHPLRAYGTAPF
ncbi:MAG: molybdopterin molybdenumtransferase MoeA [Gammaproteobacteria bacterium]|nr:MAG: molybdopterin molybdenumtransferase MoeA [Gammaproteobacteria bacterium]PIE37913.1 MAG: molybdopterin molybdenumtransferase MoeA [Gammaproteobacteria bacterium]